MQPYVSEHQKGDYIDTEKQLNNQTGRQKNNPAGSKTDN
jgi:hypothetical protein